MSRSLSVLAVRAQPLKCVPEPVALFRLVRASGDGRRSGARQLTPVVGREEETAMLMRRWEQARQGDGHLVLIFGEPGLGKSRLSGALQGLGPWPANARSRPKRRTRSPMCG